MRNFEKYKGVIPAFYACYDKDGNISPEAVQALAQYLTGKALKGLYVNGVPGECMYLSVKERKTVLENVMKVAKDRFTIIAHVACNDIKDSIELAAHAESLGVDAIAAIPPAELNSSEQDIIAYWNDISKAAPNTDFIISNATQAVDHEFTMDLFKEMSKNPRFAGIINTTVTAKHIQLFKQENDIDCVIFNSMDGQFIHGHATSAEGAIGATFGIMPELFIRLNDYVRTGAIPKATELQTHINAVNELIASAQGNQYAVIKAILKINENLNLGGVKSPLEGLTEADLLIVNEAARMIREARVNFLR